jgi:uncharacterized protein (DUF2141 family)
MKLKAICFFFCFFILLPIVAINGSVIQRKEKSVKIQFTNIRNSKGTLRLGLFKTEAEFDKEKPFKRITVSKTGIINKTLSATINLPNGTYGISVLDDENDNKVMDYNLIRMPMEGFGFSNYYHIGFSKPKLSQFIIKVDNETVKIKCKFRYI